MKEIQGGFLGQLMRNVVRGAMIIGFWRSSVDVKKLDIVQRNVKRKISIIIKGDALMLKNKKSTNQLLWKSQIIPC